MYLYRVAHPLPLQNASFLLKPLLESLSCQVGSETGDTHIFANLSLMYSLSFTRQGYREATCVSRPEFVPLQHVLLGELMMDLVVSLTNIHSVHYHVTKGLDFGLIMSPEGLIMALPYLLYRV